MISVSRFPYEWEPLCIPAMKQLEALFQGWRNTPYMAGSQGPQQGVDCVRFVCAILDGMIGRATPIEALPQDVAFHSRPTSEGAMRRLLRLYEPVAPVSPGENCRPGDIIIVGGAGGGPGHAMLVGTKKNTIWQSDMPIGVSSGGFGLTDTYQKLHRVYRLTELEAPWSL